MAMTAQDLIDKIAALFGESQELESEESEDLEEFDETEDLEASEDFEDSGEGSEESEAEGDPQDDGDEVEEVEPEEDTKKLLDIISEQASIIETLRAQLAEAGLSDDVEIGDVEEDEISAYQKDAEKRRAYLAEIMKG